MQLGNYDIEKSLPEYLQNSLAAYKEAYQKYQTDPDYSVFDCDYMEFQSDINICETDGAISSDTAWYLREKYLGLERNGAL